MGVVLIVVLVWAVGTLVLFIRMYRKIEVNQAIVRNGMGGPMVSFSGMMVVPVMHEATIVDVGPKRLEVIRNEDRPVVSQDQIAFVMKVSLDVRVNRNEEDVLMAIHTYGAENLGSEEKLLNKLEPYLMEAVEAVASRLPLETIRSQREEFRDLVLKTIGVEFSGLLIDDLAISELQQVGPA